MPRLEITTPEQVTFHYPTAGLMSRGVAWAIDLAIVMVIDMTLAVACYATSLEIAAGLSLLAVFLVNIGYYIVCELFSAGQTPGKRLMGIRVISSSGAHLRFHESLIRNTVRLLDMSLFMAGALVAFGDPLRRRLGDLVAGTIVVRDTRRSVPESLVRAQARDNSFYDDLAIRTRILNRVTRGERDLILDLMARRDELEPASREGIFARTAAYLRRRFGLPEDLEHLSDEQTVLGVALVILSTRFTA